jgi:hypothetical protein
MDLAVPRPFRELEIPNPRVRAAELLSRVPRLVRRPVPDDQDLDVGDGLREGASHALVERLPVIVRRHEDGRAELSQ